MFNVKSGLINIVFDFDFDFDFDFEPGFKEQIHVITLS
jgi:hypothetical protein